MAKNKRSDIVGYHNIKNKVSRNAFDLTHRHLYTAQIGELLPVFVQWANPNETFSLGYTGFTRTQPIQTAAFTRLKENIQYYFVPYQALWKYFEQQVNNMTTGQSGENISRIASSPTVDQPITTGMPYLNYSWFRTMISMLLDDESNYLVSRYNAGSKTFEAMMSDLRIDPSTQQPSKFYSNENLLHCSMCKLLSMLGYGNFPLENYDMISNLLAYAATQSGNISATSFRDSQYGFVGVFNDMDNYFDVNNSPNLSILPLLAYQKIINDHYIYRQWQPYKSYACNIDYLLPTDSMNFAAKLGNTPYTCELFKMQYCNLPLDYFNGVLPKAQYGDESVVSVNVPNVSGILTTEQPAYVRNSPSTLTNTSFGNIDNATSFAADSSARIVVNAGSSGIIQAQVRTPHTHVLDFSASTAGDGTLKISALRSAIALQKYKEIQESNDPDFASQVLAHYGIKPKGNRDKSVFIGGGDAVIEINPEVNQNLADGNDPEIKATGSGRLSCDCKFTSDTYGIIIGIYRCTPQLDFAHIGIDRNLFKSDASDFPLPELDNIGMQTQYRCEIAAPSICVTRKDMASVSGSGSRENSVDMAATYGYLPRYAELKTSYDRFDGAYKDSLSSWVTGYDALTLQKWMRAYTYPGLSTPQYNGIDSLLRCTPRIVYPIFLEQTSVSSNSDKLMIGSVNKCVAVRPFSVYGLPYSR